MIHLTTATEAELTTATYPHFTPSQLTPGVYQGSSWVRLGDVAHLTIPEFQELVVGPGAAGHTSGVTAFVVSSPGAAVFEPVNVPNLANIMCAFDEPHLQSHRLIGQDRAIAIQENRDGQGTAA
jgi:hypothetical protein